jgi:hypothetical protein
MIWGVDAVGAALTNANYNSGVASTVTIVAISAAISGVPDI